MIHKPVGALAMIRRRPTLIFLIIWSVVVTGALTWLIENENGPSVVIVDARDSTEALTQKRVQGFFKSEAGFAHIVPWMLFGPYVGLLALRYPLERNRMKIALPAHLLACAAFLCASQITGAFKAFTQRRVLIIARHDATQNESPDVDARSTREIAGPSSTNRGHGSFRNATIDRRVIHWSDGGESRISDSFFSDGNIMSQVGAKLPAEPAPPFPPGGLRFRYWPAIIDLLAYGAIIGVAHSIYFYRRFREREHKALMLESSLSQAQLNVLKAQLQPHFLFNSLNAIVTLLRRDPREAESTLISLSELLRIALNYSERQEITLREELDFVNRYIELQRTRFGEKLRVEAEIEPGALNALTPALLLQPIVENAIRHGIEPSDRAGLLHLSARRCGDRLALTVADNGVGLGNGNGSGPQSRNGGGIGLKNLRVRLETLYGTNQKFEIAGNQNGGASVRIEIPWRPPTTVGADASSS